MIGIYNLMDALCAEALDVTVKDYVTRIEATSEKRRTVIIGALLGEDNRKIEKAKRLFNLLPLMKNNI